MIRSLDSVAVLRYSLGLICKVIFSWLSRHSRSLFSVLVSLCSKIETVCDKKWLDEYDNLSPTPKNVVKKSNVIEFKRKLIKASPCCTKSLPRLSSKKSYDCS